MAKKLFKKAVAYFKSEYKKKEFLEDGCIRKPGNMKPFSRNRKLSVDDVFFSVVDPGRESCDAKVRRLFGGRERNKNKLRYVTQQAYSKARNKMNEKPFKDMFETMVIGEYQEKIMPGREVPVSRWGYHLFAFDGSNTTLPGTEEIKKKGYKKSGKGTYQNTVSLLEDLINVRVIDGIWGAGLNNEKAMAKEHVKNALKILGDDRKHKIMFVGDRGYPSVELIEFIESVGCFYCFRVRRKYDLIIDEVPVGSDVVSQVDGSDMRIIKFPLGENDSADETIITNAYDIPAEDFKEIYNLRWEIEKKYLYIKDRQELENFTGHTENAMKQDFYATLLAEYFISVAEDDAQEEIKKDKANCKYGYKTNRNDMVNIIKDNFARYFLTNNNAERERLLIEIQLAAREYVCQIRPGRARDKNAGRHQRKFSPNHKSNT